MDKRRKKNRGTQLEKRKQFYDLILNGALTLPQTIRQMRQLTGLTQAEYAKLTRVAEQALRDIEQGKANPTVKTLTKLIEPFGLEVNVRRRK
jgi:DNA-binding XRE family transcriptional regulator